MKRSIFPVYLVAVTLIGCLLLEWVSLELNKRAGAAEPFFWNDKKNYAKRHSSDNFALIDPHLGYARGLSESRVQDLIKKGYEWRNGFAIYKNPAAPNRRPIILALGGSTTDAVQYGHSWPEELARLLEKKQIAATVINGGVGGYSTNQELVKLIRDGLEFEPDIIISYSGVNDRGSYGELPHPFVHKYQRSLLEGLVDKRPSLMPNTLALLDRSTDLVDGGVKGYTLGVPTTRSYADWYIRNLRLMKAVSKASNADFFGVLQPNAYVGDFPWGAEFEANEGKSSEYVAALRAFYNALRSSPEHLAEVHDFTAIFDKHKEAYKKDGVHTTVAGEVLIANHIYDLIAPTLRSLKQTALH
jgi:lysophospholipase L1-like esterase